MARFGVYVSDTPNVPSSYGKCTGMWTHDRPLKAVKDLRTLGIEVNDVIHAVGKPRLKKDNGNDFVREGKIASNLQSLRFSVSQIAEYLGVSAATVHRRLASLDAHIKQR